ncbi:MAG TPA: glycosyltransferase family 1 protein, partial [Saprospiraceae bacterium]|nr:glycosyltransferase family 1 protein [Saprospiraceae bacterium]
MRIGFDSKRLFTNFTGLGNYSRALVSNYHQAFPEDELFLFTPTIKHDPRTQSFLDQAEFNIIQPRNKVLWRTLNIVEDIHRSNAEIYHGLSHELPIGISKLDIGKVVTIHDLIFKYYPADNTWIDNQMYDWKWKHACLAADKIIAISEQTKNDILHFYNILPEKIVVIYQPSDKLFSQPVRPEEIESAKSRYKLPPVFNLYVGSIISRKNLMVIIKAMALIPPQERLPLVIIGNGKNYKKKVLEEAARIHVDHLLVWLGSPAFKDFPAIYKSAQMMIYPSLHEGFGLPVIEAFQIGIPVITSNQSSLKEAGGDAALLID